MRLAPGGQAHLHPNRWADTLALRDRRKRIETLNSRLVAMGLQRLHARTNVGLALKVHAPLAAVAITSANYQSAAGPVQQRRVVRSAGPWSRELAPAPTPASSGRSWWPTMNCSVSPSITRSPLGLRPGRPPSDSICRRFG